jgi:hypothetical protein
MGLVVVVVSKTSRKRQLSKGPSQDPQPRETSETQPYLILSRLSRRALPRYALLSAATVDRNSKRLFSAARPVASAQLARTACQYPRCSAKTPLAGLLLKKGKDLCQDGLIGYDYPSTCASAASAWGSQNAIVWPTVAHQYPQWLYIMQTNGVYPLHQR